MNSARIKVRLKEVKQGLVLISKEQEQFFPVDDPVEVQFRQSADRCFVAHRESGSKLAGYAFVIWNDENGNFTSMKVALNSRIPRSLVGQYFAEEFRLHTAIEYAKEDICVAGPPSGAS